jgi:hypothetical protein
MPEQQARSERKRVKGCILVCPINQEEQRGDVRRNGAGADLLVARAREGEQT